MKIKANIVTQSSCSFGEIEFDSNITKINFLGDIRREEPYLYPGLIDLHCHGGGGFDVMEGELAIREMLKLHKANGTTSLLVTTVTDTSHKLETVFHDVAKVMDNPKDEEADIIGVHLEGPFLSKEKLGAQPNFVRPFDLIELKRLNSIAPIKILTLAPESGVTQQDLKEIKNLSIQIQLGHSNATYEESEKFLTQDCSSVTHLFNAMSSFHHRAPGVVGACLAHAQYAELIPDLIHVHPGAIKMALRAVPNLYFVTDATSASGMPDGQYKLGEHHVTKCSNGVRLSDGTLAGSSLTLAQALQNLISLKLTPPECAKRLSYLQAQLLNLSDRGEIIIGKKADLILTNESGKLICVYSKGIKL